MDSRIYFDLGIETIGNTGLAPADHIGLLRFFFDMLVDGPRPTGGTSQRGRIRVKDIGVLVIVFHQDGSDRGFIDYPGYGISWFDLGIATIGEGEGAFIRVDHVN